MKKITLFVNGDLGLHVIDSIRLNPDFEINAVILNDVSRCSKEYALRIKNHEYIRELCVPVHNYSQELVKDSSFQSTLAETTFGISALFGHVLKSEFLEKIGFKIYNLHPSLLPYGRGADPVAWGVIQNGPQGGTIHEIDAGVDTGLIVSQQQLRTDISMTAGEIYRLSIESLKVQLSQLLLRWPNLANYPITNTKSSYNKSTHLAHVRNSLIEDSSEIERVIRIIQALTFTDGRIPILRFSDGELWTVNVECTRLEGNIKT